MLWLDTRDDGCEERVKIWPTLFRWTPVSCRAFSSMTDQTIICLEDNMLKLHTNKDICSESVWKPNMKGRLTVDGWPEKDKWHQNHILNFCPFSRQGRQRKTTYPASDETPRNVTWVYQIPTMSQLYLSSVTGRVHKAERHLVTSNWLQRKWAQIDSSALTTMPVRH